jgi:5-deoxy-glucuronate isomerase
VRAAVNVAASGLHRRPSPPDRNGATVRIDPETEPEDLGGRGWRWISFSIHQLAAGASFTRPGDEREVAVVVLDGVLSIAAGGRSFGGLGGRKSVLDPSPSPLLLAAPGSPIEITARRDATIAVAAAPGGDSRETRLVDPADVRIEARGAGQTERTVRHLLPPEARAGRLIVVEVLTPGGNWSSYPPHKHDTDDPPSERLLEELYYYRFRRREGFAFQRIYTADGGLDESLAPMDGDVVLVPRGYHPVAAAAGYDCYYLNVMAGPVREWRFTLDPDHAWLMDWSPDANRR